MNNFITRINNYLIERDAVVWNTKILWVLPAAVVIHLLFFIAGYLSLSSAGALIIPSLVYDMAPPQVCMFSILISILLLVLWLIQLLKNNAFKNFYPFSRLQLFGSFLIYFFIIFVCSGFYMSYILGKANYVRHNFSGSTMKQELDKSNLAAAFLSYNAADYELNNKSYPSPFDTLYCETDNKIDEHFAFVSDSFGAYQFYTIRKDSIPLQLYQKRVYDIPVITSYTNDSFYVFYKADKPVDVSRIVSPELSVYNYSATCFDNGKEPSTRRYKYSYDNSTFSYFNIQRSQRSAQNKKVYELLKRNNPQEIKDLMSGFLAMARKYGVQTNLTTDSWFKLINFPGNFKVHSIIKKYADDEKSYAENATAQNVGVTNTLRAADSSNIKRFAIRKLDTASLYFNDEELNNVFTNVSAIGSYSIFSEVFYVLFWMAYFFAAVLFAFRVTGYKELLFAMITAVLIAIIDSLISLGAGADEMTVLYLIFFTMVLIFLLTTLLRKQLNKRMSGIFLNIAIVTIAPFLLLILTIISEHQRKAYLEISNHLKNYVAPPTLLDKLGENTHWIVFFASLICLYLYTDIIRKWMASQQ